MDFRVSEYESSVAMSREDDLSSILASTETLLKALEECSDEEDELPITIFKTEYQLDEEANETVKRELSSEDEEQEPEPKKFSPIRNHAYPRTIRRKLDSSPTSASAPATANFNRLRSPLNRNSPPFGLFTPTASMRSLPNDLQLSPSSDPFSLKREGTNEGGSFERNVSSLNIALDDFTKEATTPPPLKRKTEFIEQEHHSPEQVQDQQQRLPEKEREQQQASPRRVQPSDTHLNNNSSPPIKKVNNFAVPASTARLHNPNDANGASFSNFQETLIPYPPREQDKIRINRHDYTILKEVGRGSSGKVFQVMSHTYHQIYALKWIEVKRQDDRQSIMNEIALLRSLDEEDNIVSLLDHLTTPSVIYMVMEYGEIDLAHLIQKQTKKKWDVNFIRYYWNQMLQSVHVIHTKGIVHSDLKPANFVLVKGWLKMIDFGIAKKISDDTTNIHRGVQVGTINYMSPEALRDINEGRDGAESLMKLGRPSDIWSLGCILYQMVYGKTPFYHLQLAQKVLSIPNPEYLISFPSTVTNNDREPPVEVPPILLSMLKDCLNRNPLLRPPLQELMSHPFVNNC